MDWIAFTVGPTPTFSRGRTRAINLNPGSVVYVDADAVINPAGEVGVRRSPDMTDVAWRLDVDCLRAFEYNDESATGGLPSDGAWNGACVALGYELDRGAVVDVLRLARVIDAELAA